MPGSLYATRLAANNSYYVVNDVGSTADGVRGAKHDHSHISFCLPVCLILVVIVVHLMINKLL